MIYTVLRLIFLSCYWDKIKSAKDDIVKELKLPEGD